MVRINNSKTFQKIIDDFTTEQLQDWGLCHENYSALDSILHKQVKLDDSVINLQFNPGRIKSATAKVDAASINHRPCFLCDQNRPNEQKSFLLFNNYQLLVNPFPIFNKHYTIPKIGHIKQAIEDKIMDALQLSVVFRWMELFYNGPMSGASAPDHMHFQGVQQGSLPLFSSVNTKSGWHKIACSEDVCAYSKNNAVSKAILIEGYYVPELAYVAKRILEMLPIRDGEQEPRLNFLCRFSGQKIQCVIIPREEHRPSQYFKTKDEQFRVSPASVEVSGYIPIAFESDFERINAEVLEDIFSEVLINQTNFEQLTQDIKELFNV